MANFQKLQLSLILRVAGQIWQILQISAVICRILQIPPGSANSKSKFLSKKLAKVCSQKILQSNPPYLISFFRNALLENFQKLHYNWGFPEFLSLKKPVKFAGRIWRFLQFLKTLQILSQHSILPKKQKSVAKKSYNLTPLDCKIFWEQTFASFL